MKLVVGLGNPGKRYEGTRHNVGFDVLARVARRYAAGPVKGRFHGEVAEVSIAGHQVMLLSPLTYMNASGRSVRAAVDFYRLELGELLVICDDMNLPLATLRYRSGGSAGGQKGLADVIRHLGTDQFARLRIGIGRPEPTIDATDYVLQRFSSAERAEIDWAEDRAAESVEDWVAHGVEHCMNRYNARVDDGKGA